MTTTLCIAFSKTSRDCRVVSPRRRHQRKIMSVPAASSTTVGTGSITTKLRETKKFFSANHIYIFSYVTLVFIPVSEILRAAHRSPLTTMLFHLRKREGEGITKPTQPRSDSDSDSALMDMMESNNRADLNDDDHSQVGLPVKPSSLEPRFQRSTCTLTMLILLLGLSVSAAFLALGVSAALQTQDDSFERRYVASS
jgi:hypothetical protein